MAELVEFFEEELEVCRVIRATLRQVERLNHFVLHQDILDNLSLDLTNQDTSHLEDLKPAALVKYRITHIVKCAIIEHNVANIQFS